MNPLVVNEVLSFRDPNYDVFNNNVSHNLRSKVSESWRFLNNFNSLNGYEQVNFHGFGTKADQQNTSKVNKNDSKMSIELLVSNLDPTIEYKNLWTILLNMFKPFVKVLNISVNVQPDGSLTANVKVSTQHEAQLAITHLNHQWIGDKRIVISHLHSIPDYNEVNFIVISLLQNVPGNQMPLFKFFELVRSRYHTSVSVSEVNRLKTVCKIIDGPNGRIIKLTQEASGYGPLQYDSSPQYYCSIHCPNGLEVKGWEGVSLPNVTITLKKFQKEVLEVLSSHMGCMPLLSFPVCYTMQFKKPLPEDDNGIPLEHLLTCVSNIEIITSNNNKNVKYVKLNSTKDAKPKEQQEDPLAKTVPAPFVENVSVLCRQISDLLKTVEKCQLLITRFVPTYHHHFGRQCRLADYGFTKLTDLFEAITHCVQILGYGEKKMITLTHSVQVRRFTSDLLRVLKGQALQRVTFVNFPAAYEKVFHKTFKPTEYGLCDLEDLLAEIPEGTVTVDEVNTIAIPKREQTAEQIERTNQFRSEIEEFLCQSPYCSILFDKFIPAYHRHFARQCKVSDYGFTKLVELFEAIPETVEVEEVSDTERRVKLKLQTALEVLGGQIRSLILQSNFSTVLIGEMVDIFKQTHGYTLKALPYQCKDLTELVLKLDDFIQVTYSISGPLLSVVNVDNQVLEIQTWTLLRHPPYKCGLSKFKYEYRMKFLSNAPIRQLKGLTTALRISQDSDHDQQIISLSPLYILCAQLYQILYRRNGSVELNKIPDLYVKEYGSVLSPRPYKVNSFDNLFRQMKFLVNYQKNGNKTFLVLNKNLRNFGVPVPTVPKQSESWPPSPAHFHLSNPIHRAPPKPDTPPPEGSWNPTSSYPNQNVEHFRIYLPELDQPKCDVNDGLISPSAFGVFFPSQPIKKHGCTTELAWGKKAILDDSGYGGFNSFGQESPINSANWST